MPHYPSILVLGFCGIERQIKCLSLAMIQMNHCRLPESKIFIGFLSSARKERAFVIWQGNAKKTE